MPPSRKRTWNIYAKGNEYLGTSLVTKISAAFQFFPKWINGLGKFGMKVLWLCSKRRLNPDGRHWPGKAIRNFFTASASPSPAMHKTYSTTFGALKIK